MEKQLVRVDIYVSDNIGDGECETIQISEIGGMLLPTDTIEVECYGDDAFLKIYRMREETDDEYYARKDRELQALTRQAQRERENYERTKASYFLMKQKFEPDSI